MKKINEIPAQNPFKVPENYFEDVNRKIISATIGMEEINDRKTIRLYSRVRPYLLIAASITGFIILSYAGLRLFTNERSNYQISELLRDVSTESYISDIDIMTLEQQVADLDLFDSPPEVDESDLIDYIMLEDIEINDIYEQL